MQVNREEEREAIARIIDPDAWSPGSTVHYARLFGSVWSAINRRNSARNSALAKADAILALSTKEPSRG